MASAADQAKLKKRLEALLKLPDNQICADCRKRGPRWASANLGIFICIECSGIHRNLGVHISFVRSVNLDSWSQAQVEFMEEWGNKRSNELYEANVPPSVIRPKEGDAVRVVERFIRDKYELKRYIASSLPPKNSAPVEEPVQARRASTTTAPNRAAPVAAAPVAPKKVEPAPSLLDFMDDPAPVAPPVPVAAAPAVHNNFDPFANSSFVSAPAAVPTHAPPPAPQQHQVNNDLFGFSSPAPQQQPSANDWSMPTSAPPVPPKPQVSADAILSMYSSNAMNRPQMGMHPGHQQMGGMPMGMHQQQPHMNGHMGMPPQMNHMGMQQTHMGMPQQHNGMMHHQGGMPQQQQPLNPFQQQPHMAPQQGYPPQQMQQQHQMQQQQMMMQQQQQQRNFQQGGPQQAPMNPFGAPQQQHQQQQGFFQQQQPQAPMNPFGGAPQQHQQQHMQFQQQQQQAFGQQPQWH